MVTKAEWEAIKASHKNRCVICGGTKKQVGILEKDHVRARSKAGSQVLPMCPAITEYMIKGSYQLHN